MEGRKILAIDQDALLRGYSYSAEMMAIVNPAVCFNGPDCQVSDLLFSDDAGEHTAYTCWQDEHPDSNSVVDIQNNGEIMIINTRDIMTKGKNCAYLYEPAERKNKTCQFKAIFFKQSHCCSFCGISLASITDHNRIEYRIGFFSNNRIGYACIDMANHNEQFYPFSNPRGYQYVKLEMNGSDLISYFSCDGIQWDEYRRESHQIPAENRMMGLLLWTGDDFFKNWFFTNYIQLHSSFDMSLMYDVKLDYYLGFQFFGKHNSFCPWVREDAVDPALLNGLDCFDVVKRMIDSGYYVGVMLNERYIKNRWSYQYQDLDHENLVYGYDLADNLVYICGYNELQQFSFETISIEAFKNAYLNTIEAHDWKVMKYDVQFYEYALKKDLIIKMLKEYRDGTDSSYHEELKINQRIRVFGMNIYQILQDNIENAKDKRVTYIIHEHKKIMSERIRYLRERDLLSDPDADMLLAQSLALEALTQKLLLLGMKYLMDPKEKNEEKIRGLIDTIRLTETDFIDDFIQKLEQHDREKTQVPVSAAGYGFR